ncbi:auxin Efflux Carrier superfamily [Verticillium alfalfae VaMs.102]|uniref:Auxin Efflux Carrier superfamily n=1 Tax=Verticillium alfalfae (strain VaMs.102 / ATCC MYA-4576 / FGSC 10136) TaxID=526221 RepID=C9S9Y2_VERA1|nr:auxin Efflux Carrier superfamily [Verticillium alfalfae VaMs.102]EEY16195.1 auxin Efflux Carrier superfamily [Verticillium alfalfae VaMs.102]
MANNTWARRRPGASSRMGPGTAYEMPLRQLAAPQPHDSHPSLGHLVLLVFKAVLEVVCVNLPGYIVARLGHFDADKQKFLANLYVMLFTPCLKCGLKDVLFTNLASHLNADKLVELAVIPVIFIVQTLVSYVVATGVSRAFGFNKRASNFVTAMGVFGNSNSLPISLVLSLSQTLKGLHWDRIPGDNDDEVGARGILYLLIFQQLGQLVRWSWGYHVLLAPKDKYPEYQNERVEEGRYTDEQDAREADALLPGFEGDTAANSRSPSSSDLSQYEPGGRTPLPTSPRSPWSIPTRMTRANLSSRRRLRHQRRAVQRNVAVPLILVVLGANLARNTQKSEKQRDPEEDIIGQKLLIASLICRMLLPTLIMAPILAVFAKYVPVSILDDPIFVIVCFLLTGAPSALQLAQICQINEVYEGVMSKILFQSYVIWILPSTLVLVMCALEVVEWAQLG